MTDSTFETKVLERSRTYLTTLVYSCASGSPDKFLKRLQAAKNLQELHEGSQKFVNSMTVPQRQDAQAVLQRLIITIFRNNADHLLPDRVANLFAVQFCRSVVFGFNAEKVQRQHYLPRCYIQKWGTSSSRSGSVTLTGHRFAFGKFMQQTTTDAQWLHREENGSVVPHYLPPLEYMFSQMEGSYGKAMGNPQNDNNLDVLVLFAQTIALRLPTASNVFTFKNISQLAEHMDAFGDYWHAQVVKKAKMHCVMMTERPKPFVRDGVKSLVIPLDLSTALVLSTRKLPAEEALSLVVRDISAKRHAAMRSGEVLYGLKV